MSHSRARATELTPGCPSAQIKDRYELAGADTAAPLDPPLAGPFATLPESSTAVPTLNSLNPYSLPPA